MKQTIARGLRTDNIQAFGRYIQYEREREKEREERNKKLREKRDRERDRERKKWIKEERSEYFWQGKSDHLRVSKHTALI